MQRDINIFQIPVAHIEPHPQNPRKDLGDLTELCDSIRKNGIMQNLTVVPLDDSMTRFRCVIGHRRLAAAKEVGLFAVPATIAENMDEREQLATMIAENMQRADLTIPEQAQAVQLMLDLGEDFGSIADRTGLSESTVRRRAKLAAYDQTALAKAFKRGASLFDLEKIEKIEDPELQAKCLEKAGTKEFENALRGAKWKLETREFHNKFEAFMAGIGATIVNDRATGTGYIGCCYNDCSNMKYVLSKVEETKIKYPDAVIVYTINGRDCSVYFKSKILTEEIEKNRSKKKENDAAKEEIRDKARSLAKERWIWALRAIEAGEIASIDPIASVLAEELKDRYNWATKSEWEKILNIAKTYPAIVWENPINVIILYLIAKDGGDVPYGFEKDPEIPEDTQKMINVLTAYGYEMTQEEKDFYEGKSELFDVFKDEEDEK